MKLGAKIIVSIMIFFSVMFLFGGYVLISYFYEVTMEREVEGAIEQYQYNKFVVQASLITRGEDWFAGAADGQYDISSMAPDMNGTVAFLAEDGSVLFSDFPAKTEFSVLFSEAEQNMVNYRFMKINNRTFLLTIGIVAHGEISVYLITGVDVEKIQNQQAQIIRKFGAVYATAVSMGIFLIFGISFFITRPIKQLTAATKEIAEGNYGERVAVSGSDEVSQLARNFNRMTEAVHEKVQELSDSARQKEDFVANFAHELKTPLTSIIGYADRIYKKELPREEQKKAAWYIWNEGMRLEALSLKLMDLTILNHKDFCLQEVKTDLLFQELTADVEYLMDAKGVSLDCTVEPAYIEVEYDLFKTLFLNLLDNAVKAGAKHIRVIGIVEKMAEGTYFTMQVNDDGTGIPKQEIKRITEAFYMVDKSRSRKQHGAGIGLALSDKIAQIHGSRLEFESDGRNGTSVRLYLRCRKDNFVSEAKHE